MGALFGLRTTKEEQGSDTPAYARTRVLTSEAMCSEPTRHDITL
jgi:hypothetical protein